MAQRGMGTWWKAVGMMGLWGASVGMLIGDWVYHFRHEGVHHEHTVHAPEGGPTLEAVRITRLSEGWPAVRSAQARIHVMA